VKASSHFPGVRPGASRRFAASGPGRTGTNREGIRVRLYSPDSATDQSRFGAKIGIAPDAQRCVPVRPDTPRFSPGNRRQSSGATTASHDSRTAKPRCFTLAYEYQ